ncbi:MAG: hypothetical protein NVSMB6_01300 [Burkholderiaceae bacterium]
MSAKLISSPASTILNRLLDRVRDTPDQLAFRFLSGSEAPQQLSYRQLYQAACALQVELSQRFPAGSRLILMYPPGLDFVVALFATWLAGNVAVPVVPPRGSSGADPLAAIIANCAPAAILTSCVDRFQRRMERNGAQLPAWVDTSNQPVSMNWTMADATQLPAQDSLALIQYTSGSTSAPRGVMLSHAVLGANLAMIGDALKLDSRDVGFSWLPHYHDMGLIGAILSPVHAGFPITLMAPAAFMACPASWLQAMSEYGATICAAPNFAYDICARQLTPEECAGLRLDSVRLMLCGAEAVRPDTLERFAQRLAGCGLRADTLFPTYGLAEATLYVSGGAVDPDWFARAFERVSVSAGTPRAALPTAPQAQRLASVGRVHPAQQVLIVDPASAQPIASGHVGEIWVGGPNVGLGYWNHPELSRTVFGAMLAGGRGPFLRTGDAGFFHEESLYVTGRLKDMIILRGKNYYPQDIEVAAMRAGPAIRPDAVAAFALQGDDGDELALAFEVVHGREGIDPGLFQRVAQEIAAALQIRPVRMVAVGRSGLPRTSSGKLQRARCARMMEAGELHVVAEWQDRPASVAALPVPAELLPPYLRGLPADERGTWLLAHIVTKCAAALRTTSDNIDVRQALYGIGLDSIEIVQAVNQLRAELALDIDDSLLWQAGSIAELAQLLSDRMGFEASAASENPDSMLAALESMSDDEVASLLADLEARSRIQV